MPVSTRFKPVVYPLVGGSYSSRFKPLSQQRTLNLYPAFTEDGREDIILKSWQGLKPFAVGDGYDRGLHERTFQGLGYQVCADRLYSINSGGVKTDVGEIAGEDQVTFADNGFVLVIVGGNTAYAYDGTALTALSFPFTPAAVDYLNNQFIFTATNGRAYISTAGQTSVLVGNDFSPDSSPDVLVRAYVNSQFVLNFSTDGIEPWENTGQNLPPFERMDGAISEQTGIIGKDAVTNSTKAVYFLSANREPYQLANFQGAKIGNPGVVEAIQKYSVVSDCNCQHVTFDNLDFILFIFPAEGKVWVYVEQVGKWIELESGVRGERYLGNSFQSLFGKNLVCDYSNGNIYELDVDTYTDNGSIRARERVCRPLSGEQFQNPRQRIQINDIKFSLSTGVGRNDRNPEVMTSISTDGVSFGGELWHKLGHEGEYQQNIHHSTNVNVTDFAVKVRYTEDADFALYTCTCYVREAGK